MTKYDIYRDLRPLYSNACAQRAADAIGINVTDLEGYVQEFGRCDGVDDTGCDITVVEAGDPAPTQRWEDIAH